MFEPLKFSCPSMQFKPNDIVPSFRAEIETGGAVLGLIRFWCFFLMVSGGHNLFIILFLINITVTNLKFH